ncbi:MAG: hypothetical protein ACE5KX_08560, partial [Acidimicrobiia bacterium]
LAVALLLGAPLAVRAQLATAGGGVLVTERSTEPVGELHGESPPLFGARAYVTISWTDESWSPTLITAAERPVLRVGRAFSGLGAGLLWIEPNGYQPYPMLVSSTVVPLPLPRTSLVAIASTLPFEAFDWSLVLKLGVTVLFIR